MFSGYMILDTSVNIVVALDRRPGDSLVSEDEACNFDIVFSCAIQISLTFRLFMDRT